MNVTINASNFVMQINELVDIACCVADANWNDGALEYLVSCVEDLREVLQHCKVEALTVDTFGRKMERLLWYLSKVTSFHCISK